MNASVRRTGKKLNDCYSYRGEDFQVNQGCPVRTKYAKRFTARARRRFDKAVCREEG